MEPSTEATSFSHEQLAGQRLMVGFDGHGPTPELEYCIETLKIGGIILFSRNIESPAQLTELCAQVRDFAKSIGHPPLFVSIDQEGGLVARLKAPFTVFPGNSCMKCVEDAAAFADITASELSRVGVNMNMAPVMDAAPEGFDSIMAGRMFGRDLAWTSLLGATVIERLQKGGVMAVAKHFPGIGRTTLDSHLDLPFSDIESDDLRGFDLIPFKAAIDKKVAGVMLSHIRYDKIDDQWPASLSSIIARDILRGEMGFDGLVISDDLDMGAIEKHFDLESSISRIFDADIDIALICHQGPKIEKAFEIFLKKIGESEFSREKARASAERVMRLKNAFV